MLRTTRCDDSVAKVLCCHIQRQGFEPGYNSHFYGRGKKQTPVCCDFVIPRSSKLIHCPHYGAPQGAALACDAEKKEKKLRT